MAWTEPKRVQVDEVYALTDQGERELRGSETALSPAEIELLVRIDGATPVAQIAAEVKLLARDGVLDALRKLRDSGLIRLDAGQPAAGGLDVLTKPFDPMTLHEKVRAAWDKAGNR